MAGLRARRVVVLSDLWPPFPGGAERLAFNVARHLLRSGMDVHVLTGYENARQFDGPPVTVRPFGVHADRDAGARMLTVELDRIRPDVIVGHHLYAYAYERELADRGIPFVQLVLNTRRIAHAAHAVYISRWVMDELGDARPGDVVIHPPAFDDVAADSHGTRIGFVKPLPHKGVELVYRLAKACPGRRFLILRGEWQTLEVIRRRRNVQFMEPVEDIRDFWREVRLVLIPSVSEDAGTVAQEAAVNGVPALASNVGGLAETAAGGVLLEPDDWRGWVAAMRALDVPAVYDAVVERQRAYLASLDHPAAFDALARRVEELAWTRS